MVLLIVCSENHSICCRESVRACVYLVGCWQARKHNPVWSIHFESGLEIQADRYIDVPTLQGGGGSEALSLCFCSMCKVERGKVLAPPQQVAVTTSYSYSSVSGRVLLPCEGPQKNCHKQKLYTPKPTRGGKNDP
jgi:hypothetical protein